jgi:AraC family transcriptional regulator
LVKIAVESEPVTGRRGKNQPAGHLASQVLARGEGWSASEMICSAGPHDRVFEEQHSRVCIAIVVAGSFQYRSSAGRQLMTPGSLLLGSAGQYFECGHEHGVGDRCISFAYEPEYFEGLAAESDMRGGSAQFHRLRVPPVRELSWLVARACAGVAESSGASNRTAEWEEIGVELAARVLEIGSGKELNVGTSPATEARVTRVVRLIESRPDLDHQLDSLAREARLSRYHFLRVFQQLTGLTPHRYLLRERLRRAATRLMLEPARVLEIALDCGFGEVSNFNRAFHAEFGVSPRSFRKSTRRAGPRSLSHAQQGSTV